MSGLAVEVNQLASQVATLNKTLTANRDNPDLLDQRDLLVAQLANLTGATGRPGANNTVDVTINGRTLVSGNTVHTLDGTTGTLVFAEDGGLVSAPSGEAASLTATITDVVPRYRTLLDDVANQLVTSVNTVHAAGYDQAGTTGRTFFDPAGVTAATIQLSADVAGQPANIAAGAPVLPGPTAPGVLDGEQARLIAGLADAATGADTKYSAMITSLAVETRAATQRATIQEQVADAAVRDADSVGSVSLDEEMADLDRCTTGVRGIGTGLHGDRPDARGAHEHRGGRTMRVTSSMMMRSTLRDLSQGLSRLQETQTQISTNRALTRASTNPGATTSAMSIRQDIRRSEQRMRSLDDAQGWLSTADSALTSSLDCHGSGQGDRGARRQHRRRSPTRPRARRWPPRCVRSGPSCWRTRTPRTARGRSSTAPSTAPRTTLHGGYIGNGSSVIRDVAPSTTVAINLTGPGGVRHRWRPGRRRVRGARSAGDSDRRPATAQRSPPSTRTSTQQRRRSARQRSSWAPARRACRTPSRAPRMRRCC